MWMKRRRRFLEDKPIDRNEPGTTVVGSEATISGDLLTPGDAIVGGRVDGTLQVDGRLHLLAGAIVRGRLVATAAKLEGTVEGPIEVPGHLEVAPSARVIGEIEAGRLAIAEGALVRGTLRSETPTQRFTEKRQAGSGEEEGPGGEGADEAAGVGDQPEEDAAVVGDDGRG